MDLKDIKAIIDLMKKNSISEFELEKQEFKIRLRRGGNIIAPTDDVVFQTAAPALPLPLPAPSAAQALPAAPIASGDVEIKSPMIGTFYRAPSPESAPYVDVGAEVHPETVVCIIEAMKVMNEIKAEVHGVVTQILVENAKPVEFGQAMFKIKPA